MNLTAAHTTIARRITLLLATLLVAFAASTAAAQAKSYSMSWQPSAHQFWTANDATITKIFRNGQCTQWAAQRRPDVLRRGTEAIIAREVVAKQPENMGNWNARNWPANARRAGIATGGTPRAHALVVFQPGVLGAGSTGHIAYVQRVAHDGSFTISEMHAPRLFHVSSRHVSAHAAHSRGITFIY